MAATTDDNLRMKCIIKAVLFCIVFTALLVIFSFAKGFIPDKFERFAHGAIGTLAAFAATVLFLKFDRKRFADIGLTLQRTTIIKFFAGVIVGIGIMGLLATGVIYFTDVGIAINQKSNVLNFLLVTLPLIPLAFMEELGFRAYPLEILKDEAGVRLAIIITSILFALYHIVNGWTVASSFYGPGIWGLVFGLAAIYSKGIAMPTGIHYAANLTTAALGGTDDTGSIWTVTQAERTITKYGGVDWTTVLPPMVLMVFAIICIAFYTRRKTAMSGAGAKKQH
jgi:membrane protease YdiL (CAAX protease family)